MNDEDAEDENTGEVQDLFVTCPICKFAFKNDADSEDASAGTYTCKHLVCWFVDESIERGLCSKLFLAWWDEESKINGWESSYEGEDPLETYLKKCPHIMETATGGSWCTPAFVIGVSEKQ